MDPKKFAFRGGMLMLLFGGFAFFPYLSTQPETPLIIDSSYGLFLGLIPMNVLNKTMWLVLGTIGIMSRHSPEGDRATSRMYAGFVFGAMALLSVLGLIPATSTLYGYWPLHGANVILHALVAVSALAFAVRYRASGKDRPSDFTMWGSPTATR